MSQDLLLIFTATLSFKLQAQEEHLLPHPVIYLIRKIQALNKGHVSVEHTQPPFTVTTVWNIDCPEPPIN